MLDKQMCPIRREEWESRKILSPKEVVMFSTSVQRPKSACCTTATKRGWYRSTSGCVGSGALLVLLPKCPLCIAAYLTLWTGAGAAMSIAMHLRPALEILFAASVLFLIVRYIAANRDRPLTSRHSE